VSPSESKHLPRTIGVAQDAFPSDLTDEQWLRIEPVLPPPAAGGRRRTLDLRQVINAIRYLLHTCCGWRNLPAHFPNRSSVRHYYDAWRGDGTWARVEQILEEITTLPKSTF
jgi:transposase